MTYKRVQFRPGIVREVTNYTNSGGYYACDKIRFNSGSPMKIGGWTNYSEGNTFRGIPRAMLAWTTIDGHALFGFGTDQCVFVESDGLYNNITPIRLSSTATQFDSTNGSRLVLVTVSAHGASEGSCLMFDGTVTFNGVTITADQEYEVVSVQNSNTFYISVDATATSTGSDTTATGVDFAVNAGNPIYAVGSSGGWSAGPWSNGGWGQATGVVSADSGTQIRLWSHATNGDNMVFAPRGGEIYWWTANTVTFDRAIGLDAYADTVTKTTKNATFTSGVTTITVPDNIGITAGSVISGINIPAGTYVTLAYDGSTSVPISAATTGTSSGSYTFSYSGAFVPNTTNYILSSQTNQFLIAIGSNPYDPTSFTTSFDPMIVRWSDQTNPAEWVPETSNQSGEQRLPNGSYLVTAVDTRQEVLIWSDTAVYSMQYVGAPYIFSFTQLAANTSIISQNAAVTVSGVTYWMGKDKFYVYNGQAQTLDCPIWEHVFTSINQTQGAQVVCGQSPGNDEIWWIYPSGGSNINDSYIIYDYVENVWSYGTLNRTLWYAASTITNPVSAHAVRQGYLTVAAGASDTTLTVNTCISYPPSGVVIIDDEQIYYAAQNGTELTGCVRGYNGTTAASHVAGAPAPYQIPNQLVLHEYGTDDLLLGVANPQPISAFIETSDFDIEEGEKFAFVRKMLPDVTFYGSTSDNPVVTMTVNPRVNSGTPYTTPVPQPDVTGTVPAPLPPNSYPVEEYTGQIYTRVRGRQMAFKIESSALGVMWRLGTMRFDVRPDGRRA